MTAELPPFPSFGRYRVTHRLPAVALLALTAALTWPRWRWVGVIALVLTLALAMLVIDGMNAWRRWRWVRGFEKRIHPRALASHVGAASARFRLHVRSYQGFGVNAVLPAAVLEDVESGALAVVSPSSARIIEIAHDAGITVVHACRAFSDPVCDTAVV
jgi:hypothetical protein